MDRREDGLGDLLGEVGVPVKGFDDLRKTRRDEEGEVSLGRRFVRYEGVEDDRELVENEGV